METALRRLEVLEKLRFEPSDKAGSALLGEGICRIRCSPDDEQPIRWVWKEKASDLQTELKARMKCAMNASNKLNAVFLSSRTCISKQRHRIINAMSDGCSNRLLIDSTLATKCP
jgi:hypothetical protein